MNTKPTPPPSPLGSDSCSVSSLVPYYDRDGITIYHGDCREILPVLGRFDLLLTDPPYGMNALDGSRTTRRYGMARKGNWDDEKIDGEAIAAAMEKATVQIIWGMNYLCNLLPPHKKFLMWQKPHVEHLETRSSAEIAFTNIPGPAKHHRCRCDSNPQHPTQKPLGLMQWCIQQAGDVETILDPWAGSGTTGHAAKNLGKRCVMIEREERYCEIAAARLAQDVLQFSPQNKEYPDALSESHPQNRKP